MEVLQDSEWYESYQERNPNGLWQLRIIRATGIRINTFSCDVCLDSLAEPIVIKSAGGRLNPPSQRVQSLTAEWLFYYWHLPCFVQWRCWSTVLLLITTFKVCVMIWKKTPFDSVPPCRSPAQNHPSIQNKKNIILSINLSCMKLTHWNIMCSDLIKHHHVYIKKEAHIQMQQNVSFQIQLTLCSGAESCINNI